MNKHPSLSELQVRYEQALAKHGQGDTEAAVRAYRDVLHLAPDFCKAHYQLGLLFIQMQEFAWAKRQFHNVLELMPQNLHAQFYLGIIALSEQDYDMAESYLHTVLEQDPEQVEALTNLGVIALKRDKGQEAIAYFTKALAINNHHLEARHNLAATFIHHDRFENALIHYQILLEAKPDEIEYLYNSGVAEMALGQLDSAIQLFKKIIKIDPKHFDALSNLAAIYLRKEQRDEARLFFKEAQKIKPTEPVTAFMLQALNPNTSTGETCVPYVENLFNQYALYYDEHMQKTLVYNLPQQLKQLLEKEQISRQEKALDLGCGTGLSGEVLKPYCHTLTGVDLSTKMIKIAEKKQIYNELHEMEISAYLQQESRCFNLIVALDVLPYFGDLNHLFKSISQHLATQGFFIFTTEISESSDWILQSSARFAHHQDYLHQLIKTYDLQLISQQIIAARKHDQNLVQVYMIMVQKNVELSIN